MNDYNIISRTYSFLEKENTNNGFFKFYSGTTSLVARDLPLLIKKYLNNGRILDFGCGTGISTRLVRSSGYSVTGVDIFQKNIDLSKSKDPDGLYIKINREEPLPFPESTFDMVVSVLVLMELSSLQDICLYINKVKRVLKKGGYFIIVVNSENLYNHNNWLSLKTDYSQNKNLKSGDNCKIKLTDIDLELNDYYWSDSDYMVVFKKSGIKVVEKHLPYGQLEDGVNWLAEYTHSPIIMYVCKYDN